MKESTQSATEAYEERSRDALRENISMSIMQTKREVISY